MIDRIQIVLTRKPGLLRPLSEIITRRDWVVIVSLFGVVAVAFLMWWVLIRLAVAIIAPVLP